MRILSFWILIKLFKLSLIDNFDLYVKELLISFWKIYSLDNFGYNFNVQHCLKFNKNNQLLPFYVDIEFLDIDKTFLA